MSRRAVQQRDRRAGAIVAICAALLASTLAACGSSSPSAVTGAAPHALPRLHAEGQWLVDQLGRVVILHGVGLVNNQPPYYVLDDPAGFQARDADWLAAHGFDQARLAITFGGIMAKPGVIDRTYLAAWDRVVKLLAARHIWMLLDMHQDFYNEAFGGQGFPSWAIHDNGLAMPTTNLGSILTYIDPAYMATWENFWANRYGLWGYYAQAWQAVARKWAAQPYLMGYEIINEPSAAPDPAACLSGCKAFDTGPLQAMQQFLYRSIRSVDPVNMVWFEPGVAFDSGAPTFLGTTSRPHDVNLGFAWHNYCATFGAACSAFQEKVFANGAAGADQLGAASFLSEFGGGNDPVQIGNVVRMSDEHLVGWSYWRYKRWGHHVNYGLFDDDTNLASLRTNIAALLIRAYPQATAGIPTSLSYDGVAHTMRYAYAPRAAGGPTLVFVPLMYYPHGYVVQVSGGRVVSKPGAAVVEIDNAPGSAKVTVTLQRA